MPNIQRPLQFKYPRISQSLIRYGYKPHLPVQERREILEDAIEAEYYGAKAVWYKLDQLALYNQLKNKNNKVYNIVKRDRNWIRKHFL